MKILITTDWYEPVIKGVVTSVVNLSNKLKKRGHELLSGWLKTKKIQLTTP